MHSHASSFALSEGAGSSVDVILPQPDHHQYSDRKQNTLNENELLFDLNSSNCKSETDDQYDEDELMYVLRRKPKRSRRFEDQDFTNENQEPLPSKSINVDGDDPEPARRTMPAASFNKKPMFTCKLQDKPPPACTECGKEFNSWKALFGHMRCHPEREWRGIQPPAEHLSSMRAHKDSMARNGASESNRYIVVKPLQASKQEMLRRKEMVNQLRSSQSASFSHDVTKAANHSQSREDGLPDEYTILGSIRGDEKLRWSLCRKQVMLEEEEESDTESIEAAYMSNNKDEEDKCLHLLASFSRGKRSKRSHFTVKSLRSVQDKLAAKVVEMEPQDEDLEMANCLVMLALAGSVNIEGGNPEGGTVSKSDDDNDEDDDEGTVDDQLRLTCRSNVSCTATAVDDSKALHIQNDISVSNLDDINAGDGGKYECAACKRSFKSHQALGGHRASHKKVKGCFAKTAGDVEASSMSSKDGIATTTTYLDTSILTLAGVCKDQMVTASTTHLGTSLPDRNADCKDSIATSGTYAGTSAYGISGGHVSGRGGLNIASSAPNVAESGPAFQLLLDSIDGLTSKSSKLTLHNPSKFHQCSICQRVFSSGQALGGHKRCHWAADKADRHASEMGTGISATACVATPPTMAKLTFFARPPADEEATHQVKVLDIDLNLPAPLDVDPVNSTNAKVINTCKNNSALGSLLSLGQCSSVTIHAPIDLDDESFHSGGPNATGPHSVAEPAAYSGTSSPSSTTSTHVSEIGPCL